MKLAKGEGPIARSDEQVLDTLVSIVIPHYTGDILSECLSYVFERTKVPIEVIVVDDASPDGSVSRAQRRFPHIRVVRNERNLGFTSACNRGMEAAQGKYVILLNNDTQVTEGWLVELLKVAESDPNIAACQPKIRSLKDQSKLDYAGGAGGLMDLYGYPFALGRVFHVLEEDHGQYDEVQDLFWASGTAMFLRKAALEQTGTLDEELFMHQEEIDLCWRMHLMGLRVCSAPASVIYHHSGWTLPSGTYQKMYLNHRNSLVLLLKNWSVPNLLWIFPIRLLLEGLTIKVSLLKFEWKRALAAMDGLIWVFLHPLNIWRRRRRAQRVRRVSDASVKARMFQGSVVYQFFVKGVKTAGVLLLGEGEEG